LDFRRALLAAILSIGVLFVWQLVFPPAERPVGGVDGAAEEIVGNVPRPGGLEPTGSMDSGEPSDGDRAWSDEPFVSASVADDADVAGAGLGEGVSDGAGSEEAPLLEEIVDRSEYTSTLETREFRATFSNRGAELVSLELWNHEESDGELVDLVRSRSAERAFPFGLVDPASGASLPLNDALFVATEGPHGEDELSLLYEYRGPLGQARKRFTITKWGAIRAEVEAAGKWSLLWGPGLRTGAEGAGSGGRFEKRSVVWRRDGEVDREDLLKFRETMRLGPGGLDWVGLDDTYFLSVVLPQEGLEEASIFSLAPEDGVYRRILEGEKVDKKARVEAEILLRPEGERLRVVAYMGTKEYEKLIGLPGNLAEDAEQSGFLGMLSRPLQVGLRWIYANVVQNYGWAIVLLTVLIKLLLFPLTQKSMVSMAKMQELNPKIQAIRTKYRPKLKDKQGRPNSEAQRKMNEEIMGLYKSEGVNPAGGCLPMLVQLPIFFALFRLLGSAIELRNAPWIFWITDLSVADPWKVLPVLMGASQLLQQKMTPMSGDPMQKRLMTFMPLMFMVFAFTFPAGLVLYWLTSNILTIVQNDLYKRWKARAEQKA